MKTQYPSQEEGQSIVLVALVFVALIAIAGLVVDGGRDYGARRQSQNASDGAAFAGASVLAAREGNGLSDDRKVRDAIYAYALNNGVAATSDIVANYTRFGLTGVYGTVGGGSIPSDANGVRVETSISFQPFLITVLSGGGSVTARTLAIAKIGVLKSPNTLRPVTIKDQAFVYGAPYKLQGGVTGPGNFQWLNLDGINVTTNSCPSPDTNGLADRIDDDSTATVPDMDVNNLWICGNPGEHTAVKDEMQEWFDDYPSGPRLWIIPIYDVVDNQGNRFRYHIVKFAVFNLAGYYMGASADGHEGDNCDPQPPGNKCIVGTFVRYATLADINEGENCVTSEVDVCGAKLTE